MQIRIVLNKEPSPQMVICSYYSSTLCITEDKSTQVRYDTIIQFSNEILILEI